MITMVITIALFLMRLLKCHLFTFSFHEIDYHSHVCKIYFKAHIKDNNDNAFYIFHRDIIFTLIVPCNV